MPFTLPLGSKAIDFNLVSTENKKYSLKDFADAKLLVLFFTCNHCPYVINSDPITAKTAKKYEKEGVRFVGINSNSDKTYKEDGFAFMQERMKKENFPWIYLHDPTQEVAQAYGALRTPHFFLFDEKRKLIYCGAGVDQPRKPELIQVNYLEEALECAIHKQPITRPLTNPIGCNVKWEGKDPHWMPPEACDLIRS